MSRCFVCTAALSILAGCGATPPRAPEAGAPRSAGPVKITHFYSAVRVVSRGEKALVCYGVENANAVAISPPVERLSPSFNRCFTVAPRRTTHYLLTAAGAGGQSATASFDITVLETPSTGPVAIEQVPGPTIEYFRDDGATRDGDNEFHKLCFATRYATQVRVDPAVIPPMNTPLGCFTARVDRTTIFTLFAYDERGNTASQRPDDLALTGRAAPRELAGSYRCPFLQECSMRRSWLVLFALSAVYLGFTFAGRRSFDSGYLRPSSRTSNPLPPEYSDPKNVHIVHFYAGSPVLTEGESTVLCYGVVNAASVRLDPPVEALSPSFNRCIRIAPEETTRYTLYVSGREGQRIAAVFELPVRADPARLPRIKRVWTKWVQGDRFNRKAHCLCFEAENTSVIDVEPQAFAPYHGVTGCFYVVPEATTTYTIIGRDRKGREARKRVTIEVQSPDRGGASWRPAGLLAGNSSGAG